MTDLAAVLAGLQAVLSADAAIGLTGSEANHLRLVAPNVEWIVAQMPSAALLVAETQRVAGLGGQPETVTATFEVRLAIDGGDGRGDVPGIVALVEQVRRVLIQNDTLNSGNPPTGSAPAVRPARRTRSSASASAAGCRRRSCAGRRPGCSRGSSTTRRWWTRATCGSSASPPVRA
jgi:hypothetical protein